MFYQLSYQDPTAVVRSHEQNDDADDDDDLMFDEDAVAPTANNNKNSVAAAGGRIPSATTTTTGGEDDPANAIHNDDDLFNFSSSSSLSSSSSSGGRRRRSVSQRSSSASEEDDEAANRTAYQHRDGEKQEGAGNCVPPDANQRTPRHHRSRDHGYRGEEDEMAVYRQLLRKHINSSLCGAPSLDDDDETNSDDGNSRGAEEPTGQSPTSSAPPAASVSLEQFAAKLRPIAAAAAALLQALDDFGDAQQQLRGGVPLVGLSRLRTKFEREAQMSSTALADVSRILLQQQQQLQEQASSSSSSALPPARLDNDAARRVESAKRYAMCHCLPLLELTLHTLCNEPNVVAVMVPINANFYRDNAVLKALGYRTDRSTSSSRNHQEGFSVSSGNNDDVEDEDEEDRLDWKTVEVPSVSFDVDIVCHGGARWIKVKGTSPKNLQAEVQGEEASGDRRPFLEVITNFRHAAWCTLLPYGQRPEPVIYFYYSPKAETLHRLQAHRYALERPLRGTMEANPPHDNGSDTSKKTVKKKKPSAEPSTLFGVQFFSFESLIRYGLSEQHCKPSTAGPMRKQPEELHWDDAGRGVLARGRFASRYWRALQTTTPPFPFLVPHHSPFSLLYAPRPPPPYVPFVNFDVTALVALCSDTCNGFAGVALPGFKILDEQSRQEVQQRSVMDFIDVCLHQNTRCSTRRSSSSESSGDDMKADIEAQLRKVFQSRLPSHSDNGVINTKYWAVHRASDFLVQLNDVQRRLLFVESLELSLYYPSSPSPQEERTASSVSGSRFLLRTTSCEQGIQLDETFAVASQFLQPTVTRKGGPPPSHSSTTPHTASDEGIGADASDGRSAYNWVLSDVALSEFLWIMHTIAGPAEYRRALRLLDRMYVVFLDTNALYGATAAGGDDLKRLEGAAIHFLNHSTKINERHKAVFGLGDILHAVTLTANKQFVQAAKDQGVEVEIAFHPSRALTERKRTGADHMGGPKKPPSLSMDDWGTMVANSRR